jgi:hypothetical protein
MSVFVLYFLILLSTITSRLACGFEVPFRCESIPLLRARELEERLDQIKQRVVVVVGGGGGEFGEDHDSLVSNDPQYSVQRMQIAIATPTPSSSLGIELIEIGERGAELVVVSDVSGSAAQTNLQVGDIISAVVLGEYIRFQTSGYDATISAIQKARQEPSSSTATSNEVIIEINRLVENAIVQ